MKKIVLSLAVLAASGAYVWNQWGADPGEALIGMTPVGADTETALADPVAAIVKETIAAVPANPPTPVAIQPPAPLIRSREPVNPPPGSAAITVPAKLARPLPPAPATAPALVEVTPAHAAPMQDIAAAASLPEVPRPRPRPRQPMLQLQQPARRELKPFVVKASMTVAASGYADGTFTGPAVDAYYGIVQIQAVVQQGQIVGIKVLRYPSDRRTSVAINRQALPMLRDEAVAAQSANIDIVSGATLTSEAFARSLKGALQRAMA